MCLEFVFLVSIQIFLSFFLHKHFLLEDVMRTSIVVIVSIVSIYLQDCMTNFSVSCGKENEVMSPEFVFLVSTRFFFSLFLHKHSYLEAVMRTSFSNPRLLFVFHSGLEQDGRGVQPVYLSCSSGRVEWQYPRAGLRVILKSPHKGRDFHACIKGDPKFEGARIYLEGHRSLLPLFALDDGRPQNLLRCFTSYKGQAALYVEAEPGADDLKKQVAAFEYDLQSLSKGAIYDPMEGKENVVFPESDPHYFLFVILDLLREKFEFCC